MISRITNLNADLIDLLDKRGQDFFSEAKLPGKFKLNSFLNSWHTLLRLGYGAMWSYERDGKICGLLGAIISYDMNDGATIASEAFWFVLRECRGDLGGVRLLDAFQTWAEQIGAERILIAHVTALHPGRMSKFYERRGFQPVETNFVKEVPA